MPTVTSPIPRQESSGTSAPRARGIRRTREPGESECCSQKLAALVEHALLDELIRPQQQRLRNRQPEGLGGLQVNHQLELRGLLDGEIGGVWTPSGLVPLPRRAPGEGREDRPPPQHGPPPRL